MENDIGTIVIDEDQQMDNSHECNCHGCNMYAIIMDGDQHPHKSDRLPDCHFSLTRLPFKIGHCRLLAKKMSFIFRWKIPYLKLKYAGS